MRRDPAPVQAAGADTEETEAVLAAEEAVRAEVAVVPVEVVALAEAVEIPEAEAGVQAPADWQTGGLMRRQS
jgi:Spy/CpxP family protein refolding chaperone